MTKRGTLFSRAFPNLRLRLLDHAIIRGIPTIEFMALIKTLKSEGWSVTDEFYDEGVIARYAKIDLQNSKGKLTLEWDNKDDGSIEGDGELIREVASSHGFISVDNRHWARKDSWAA